MGSEPGNAGGLVTPDMEALAESEMSRRRRGNRAGNDKGIRCCPRCGDSMLWKAFYEIPVSETSQEVKSEGGGVLGSVVAKAGFMLLCMECWPRTGVGERLELLKTETDKWLVAVRKPARVHREGGFVPLEQEVDRYERELAEVAGRIEALKEAVIRCP